MKEFYVDVTVRVFVQAANEDEAKRFALNSMLEAENQKTPGRFEVVSREHVRTQEVV